MVRCVDNSLYSGITTNLKKRVKEHNVSSSRGAKYMRAKKPVALAYFEEYPTIQKALRRESEVKKWTKLKKEALTQSKTNNKKINFSEKVYTIVRYIPRGKTLSYQQVAGIAGNKRAYRAVGNILNKNYDPSIPCHRVIRADGKAGGYNMGIKRKKELLQSESI